MLKALIYRVFLFSQKIFEKVCRKHECAFVFGWWKGKTEPFIQLNSLVPRVIQDFWIVCDDMSLPKDEIVHSINLQYSVKKRAKEMARYQGAEIYY